MELKGLRCLVTGGAGFIGSHLVDKLIAKGCYVRVVDNLSNGKRENLSMHNQSNSLEFFEGDITDPFDVKIALKGVDIVFHLACLGVRHSISHPFENHRVNSEGTLLVLDAAYRQKVKRFLYCSSSEVYGTAEYAPMPETHPTMPCTIYGASKLAGEAYTRAYYKTYNMDAVIIRPFNTFGPRSHYQGNAGEMIPRSIVRALSRKPIIIFGDGSQTRDFTYVEDTAIALVTAMETDSCIGRTMNIGCHFEISMKDLGKKIAKLLNDSKVKIELKGSRPGDVLRLCADPTLFMSTTGWKPKITFEEGLERTIQYFGNLKVGLDAIDIDNERINWRNHYL